MSRREIIKSKAPLQRPANASDDEAPMTALTEVQLPEIDPAFGYLLELYCLAGQVNQNGMSITPLTWEELKAFREENELDLCVWERNILKRMSEEYCSEYAAASALNRPAPYIPEQEEDEDIVVVEKINSALSIRDTLAALRGNNGNQ